MLGDIRAYNIDEHSIIERIWDLYVLINVFGGNFQDLRENLDDVESSLTAHYSFLIWVKFICSTIQKQSRHQDIRLEIE